MSRKRYLYLENTPWHVEQAMAHLRSEIFAPTLKLNIETDHGSMEPPCTNSDATTPPSSILASESPGSPMSDYRAGLLSVTSQHIPHSRAVSVFEQLKKRFNYERTETEDVAGWLNEMKLSSPEDKERDFLNILTALEGNTIPETDSGVRKCPPNRSQGTKKSAGRTPSAQAFKAPTAPRRKRLARSEVSQSSKHESESSHASVVPFMVPTAPFKNWLACPFAKHDRDRYEFVRSGCTERFGFPTPARVVEHVKRVHSLSVPCCTTCKQRFHGNTPAQNEHACRPRQLSVLDPEWMDKEQNERFAGFRIQGSSPEEKWRYLYRHLFSIQNHEEIPDPYYDYLVPHRGVTQVNIPASAVRECVNEPGSQVAPPEDMTVSPTANLQNPRGILEEPNLAAPSGRELEGSEALLAERLPRNTTDQSAFFSMYARDVPMATGATRVENGLDLQPDAFNITGPLPTVPHLTESQLELYQQLLTTRYEIPTGQDSGYQSLEHAGECQLGDPIHELELPNNAPGDDDPSTQPEHGLLNPDAFDQTTANLDLFGLQTDPFDLLDDYLMYQSRRPNFEDEF